MKKLVLVCMALFLVAALTAPAQAFPLCFKFVDFCDGLSISNFSPPENAFWWHWDCANNSPMDAKRFRLPLKNNCPIQIDEQNTVLGARSLAPNGPGDYYFIIDLPDDNGYDLDMHMGIYPDGTCWIDQLAYVLEMGICGGIAGQGNRSTIQ